jgi:hypothetical protein
MYCDAANSCGTNTIYGTFQETRKKKLTDSTGNLQIKVHDRTEHEKL